MADGYLSKLVNVVSGVPQGVVDPLLFLLHSSDLFSIQENKLTDYSVDSTLMAVVPSLRRDLDRDSQWCDLWG